MTPTATIILRDGPLDGAEIVWPENAGDFPVEITFGLRGANEGIVDTKAMKRHKYFGFWAYSHGPDSPSDGLPLHEVQEYTYDTGDAKLA